MSVEHVILRPHIMDKTVSVILDSTEQEISACLAMVAVENAMDLKPIIVSVV